MDFTPDRSRLRYVDAGDLDDSTIDFDGLKVRNAAGEKLGDVDGVVVDVSSGRPYYVVVDSGGWFRSKLFLLPIGHVRLDHDNDALVADLTRDRIERFPGFDRDEFAKLSDAELDRMDEQIASCCCPSDTAVAASAPSASGETRTSGVGRWAHHELPSWWDANYYRPDRAGARGVTTGAEYRDADVNPTGTRAANLESSAQPNQGRAGADAWRQPTDASRPTRAGRDVNVGEAEAVVAREGGETSPHVGGRAEPGDVIGIETGGERTYLGDTAEEENDRRRDAEKDAGKQAEDDLKDRR